MILDKRFIILLVLNFVKSIFIILFLVIQAIFKLIKLINYITLD